MTIQAPGSLGESWPSSSEPSCSWPPSSARGSPRVGLVPGNAGLQLLINAAVTGATLVAILLAVGPISGAHLNPVVTLADRAFGGLSGAMTAAYVAAQFAGAIAGVILANLMFGLPAVDWATTERFDEGLWLGEAVAIFGLLLVVFGVVRSRRAQLAPFAVGAYIFAAIFFTSSTSFANPAVTVGRMFSDTFAGIDPASVPSFVIAEAAGAVIGYLVVRVLYPGMEEWASEVVLPHEGAGT
jgi:glycerol uptake facilitator-like aquaporin